ncbi:MAG: single-stranded-DNA-specific exonuclease RecJ [Lentisphaeria bacterium]|nr:single-stranded-DNA-specific exonuclease RecJ [Lentisphaeria bacterium]
MSLQQKSWHIQSPDEKQVAGLQQNYQLSKPIADTLVNRSWTHETVEQFFYPTLRDLGNPFELPPMRKAVQRIWDAIQKQEKILIHGDFDTDGITSTALLYWVLNKLGANVDCHLPLRDDNGCGLTVESVDRFKDIADVIITVDSGITSIDGAAFAKENGIDVIITDHHQPAEVLPDVYALINPKLFPEFTNLAVLAGVGVTFKLCHAIVGLGYENKVPRNQLPDLREGMDLVALGTVADIVPLTGENRCLVKYGMQILATQKRPGIHAMCGLLGIHEQLRTEDITFRLAPRLNAAGRMGDANEALQLLICDNIIEAYDYAKRLNKLNKERQKQEEETYRAAKNYIKDNNLCDEKALLVVGQDWHRGVIGIVASRLTQEYCRPSIVLTNDDEFGFHGSGRSLNGINLIHCLDNVEPPLKRYGGHPMAVGLALDEECLSKLNNCFTCYVEDICYGTDKLDPTIHMESTIKIDQLNEKFFEDLERMMPFGLENPAPVFLLENVYCPKPLRAGRNNSRGHLVDYNGNTIHFICFGTAAEKFPVERIDVAVIPEMNYHNGVHTPQLQVIDLTIR